MEMPSCSRSSSDIAHAKKDCRVATVEQQQLEYLEFYYCAVGKGWLCKTCANFSGLSSPGVPYIAKACIFGDHHLQKNTESNLEFERHKEAIKNKVLTLFLANAQTFGKCSLKLV